MRVSPVPSLRAIVGCDSSRLVVETSSPALQEPTPNTMGLLSILRRARNQGVVSLPGILKPSTLGTCMCEAQATHPQPAMAETVSQDCVTPTPDCLMIN